MHKGLAFYVLPSAFGLFATDFFKKVLFAKRQGVEWREMHLPFKTHLGKDYLSPPIISFVLGSGALYR